MTKPSRLNVKQASENWGKSESCPKIFRPSIEFRMFTYLRVPSKRLEIPTALTILKSQILAYHFEIFVADTTLELQREREKILKRDTSI